FPGVGDDTEFLKLDEEKAGGGPLAGWADFFDGGAQTQKNENPERGFYDFYPVFNKKSAAITVATYTDPIGLLKIGDEIKEQPYLVTMAYGSGKVVWIGSGETWRLRKYREAYHERFWTKLARYVSSAKLTQQSSQISLHVGTEFTVNDPV